MAACAPAVGTGDEDTGKVGLTVDELILSGRGPVGSPVLPGRWVTVGFGTEETPYREG